MTMDRWGDSTHKMSAYNNRYHPSNRDQRQIDRMERETMVLYPTLQPNPILPNKSPGFSGGRGIFRGLNWRAEGLRIQPSRNELETGREEGPSTSSFYRQQREAAPFVTRRRFHRKVLPEGHTEEHLTTLHPPVQRRHNIRGWSCTSHSSKGKGTQTPHWLPIPGMNLTAWKNKKEVEKKKVLGMPLPQKDCLRSPSNCTLLCPTSWTSLTGGSG